MEEIILQPLGHYLLRSKVIIPIESEPILDGSIEIVDQRIVGLYPYKGSRHTKSRAKLIDLEDLILFPALCNTHTHLELSALRFRIPPAGSFVQWLSQLLPKRERLSPGEIAEAAKFALQELWREGVSLVADVGNTGITLPLLESSPLKGYFFQEILCFKGKADLKGQEHLGVRIKVSYSAHSPYTVTPIMLQAIKAYNHKRKRPFMIHCAESKEEVEFLTEGQGQMVKLLKDRGKWENGFIPPGLTPVGYLERLDLLDERTILVHCVHLSEEDFNILKKRRPTICLCPRSNLYTGAGLPPLPKLLASGLKVVLGTDSLASVDKLSLFEEIRTLHHFYPQVPPQELLLMATKNGAEALGTPSACIIKPQAPVDLLAIKTPFPLSKDPKDLLIEFIRAEKEIVYRIHA